MRLNKNIILAGLLSAGLAFPLTAFATNGYFSIGYGPKSRGLAGASVAHSTDSMAAAVNPAGISNVGHRADFSVELFSPIREAQSGMGGPGAGPVHQDSQSNYFLIPSGGYVRDIGNNLTAGITIYANGGMNTSYRDNAAALGGGASIFGATSDAGVDLAQMIFAPTIAWKFLPKHSIGASLLIGYQQFKAYGLQNFCSLKAGSGGAACPAFGGIGSPGANKGLTNQGYDRVWGLGVRVGYQGQITDNVSIGAAYSSKIGMSEFDKYDKLFAEDGDFDIPANWSVGLAVKATPRLTVTADIQRIEYGDIRAIANHGPTTSGLNVFAEGQGFLGANNGLGFGWDDMTIFKLGVEYNANNKWTLRGGISRGDQPIGNDEITFNILAPAVIETHVTAGFTYRPAGKADNEWNFAYMYAVNNEESGAFPDGFCGAGGTLNCPIKSKIEMYQHAFELGYSWKF
ncbi:MAG: outer membrane protein transport protein [Gammaproteobacteria bacterium]|nr:MAG: outer membrane protein transport protein [Gammaproteobacteria bacterium]